ncbi:MAG TPA: excalibur calcium-binding domain-containing protein [Acidimicrobiales bacterium]|nr:excalibur calcium-binding domain-containing protein [Acidimicrobiales bacterium]
MGDADAGGGGWRAADGAWRPGAPPPGWEQVAGGRWLAPIDATAPDARRQALTAEAMLALVAPLRAPRTPPIEDPMLVGPARGSVATGPTAAPRGHADGGSRAQRRSFADMFDWDAMRPPDDGLPPEAHGGPPGLAAGSPPARPGGGVGAGAAAGHVVAVGGLPGSAGLAERGEDVPGSGLPAGDPWRGPGWAGARAGAGAGRAQGARGLRSTVAGWSAEGGARLERIRREPTDERRPVGVDPARTVGNAGTSDGTGPAAVVGTGAGQGRVAADGAIRLGGGPGVATRSRTRAAGGGGIGFAAGPAVGTGTGTGTRTATGAGACFGLAGPAVGTDTGTSTGDDNGRHDPGEPAPFGLASSPTRRIAAGVAVVLLIAGLIATLVGLSTGSGSSEAVGPTTTAAAVRAPTSASTTTTVPKTMATTAASASTAQPTTMASTAPTTTTTAPATTTTPVPTTAPPPTAPPPTEPGVYYRNCIEAAMAGATPIQAGEPGYRPELDLDGDGEACEWDL